MRSADGIQDIWQAQNKSLFTLYSFCTAKKSYRIGILLTHKNGCGGAISVTGRSCAAPISKVERHITNRFCSILWCSVLTY